MISRKIEHLSVEQMFDMGGERSYDGAMADKQISARQREILEFIESHIADHGYPPSVRDIGHAVGLTSPSTVHSHLNTLTKLGYLRRDPTLLHAGARRLPCL
jgi:repressor LexA